jgi:hypothetical protein
VAGVICGLLADSVLAAGAPRVGRCGAELVRQIPTRPAAARGGSAVARQVMALSGAARDEVVAAELLAGNVPAFLRRLRPVRLTGALPGGRRVTVTICVAPDYLAVGSDRDFLRVPMGLPAAATVADRFGFLLPTTRMVDAIYAQASLRLEPRPMPPTARMRSTDYLLRHNRTVNAQRAAAGTELGVLTAGQKKDLVLSKRLISAPGRVAIYGWQRENGTPIQPLSTVHGAFYADYSHGVRLISTTAYVNGSPEPLTELLKDPVVGPILSREGPLAAPRALQASLHEGWAVPSHATPELAVARH